MTANLCESSRFCTVDCITTRSIRVILPRATREGAGVFYGGAVLRVGRERIEEARLALSLARRTRKSGYRGPVAERFGNGYIEPCSDSP